ncbi:protein of unknown function [Burkholderia multivorans]
MLFSVKDALIDVLQGLRPRGAARARPCGRRGAALQYRLTKRRSTCRFPEAQPPRLTRSPILPARSARPTTARSCNSEKRS